MKTKLILKTILAFIAVVAVIGLFVGLLAAAAPKKLATPVRWSESVTATGTVTKVSGPEINVRLLGSRKNIYFPDERGFTNGQRVLITVTANYIRRYDAVGYGGRQGALEWYTRTVMPFD